jgi:hypothetical protein
MADIMLKPSRKMAERWHIPPEVMEEAYGPRSRYARERGSAVERIRALLGQQGLVPPLAGRLWAALGVA